MTTMDTLARGYRLDFGWTTIARRDQLAVRLDHDVIGVWMPLGVSASVLIQLSALGLNRPPARPSVSFHRRAHR